MSCSSEAHTHDHNDAAHAHDHSNDLPTSSTTTGDKFSLYGKINRDEVVGLNVDTQASEGGGDAREVIKPWDEREDEVKFCQSDADDSMIVSIPFTAQVKLRSIVLKTGPGGHTPESCHLYVNGPGLDFSAVESIKPKEVVKLVVQRESVEYALRPSKFSAVTSIQLYFPNNISRGDDEETSRIYFIGFKGEWNELTKNPEGIILYEAQANPSDHTRVKGLSEMGGSRLGM